MICTRVVSMTGGLASLAASVLALFTILTPNLNAQKSLSTLTTLYSFGCCIWAPSGTNPAADLLMDKHGTLYGTALQGGTSSACASGCGTVFALTPSVAKDGTWTETVLHTFTGGSDGAFPQAGLVMDQNGALYGTAYGGGAGAGAVYQLTPPATAASPWAFTVLYAFSGGSDGANPQSRLVMDQAGALYGTTFYGGLLQCPLNTGCGTLFQLTPPVISGGAWTEKVLYTFTGGSDGANPVAGLIMDKNGALYGTTYSGGLGGGTVFQLTPPIATGSSWTETVLYTFTGNGDGAFPQAGLIFDKNGALYGTSTYSAFQLTPPTVQGGSWTAIILHNFPNSATDGAYVQADLVFGKNGVLYGTTFKGGVSGCGTVFALTPPASKAGTWTETALYNFTGGYDDGCAPDAGLVMGKQSELYGTTFIRGGNGSGTVFELIP